MSKVVVVGAGPAGMMAGIAAADDGHNVIIYEKNEKVGKKLFITGKGRCNVTNASDIEDILNNIVTNNKFMYSSLYTFTNDSVMEWFENEGLRLKVERGNRVFPASDKSSDVINILKKALKDRNVFVNYNTDVKDLMVEDGAVKGIIINNGEKVTADKVIMATGGVSYPVTGSDGAGMKLLEKYGHSITKLRPALVPMNVKEEYAKELQGLSLKNIEIHIYRTLKSTKKPVYSEFGEMMFTHFGVTGPVILSVSRKVGKYLQEEELRLVIDLKPALTKEQLDARILREFDNFVNKDFKNAIDSLLPKKMIPVIIDYCKINPYKKVNVVSKEERERLVNALKGFEMTITSLRGFNEAIITQGGISVKEINPGTMESKIIRNLYVAGEMLDVDALTGGYNLQIAWSTGYLAGKNMSDEM